MKFKYLFKSLIFLSILSGVFLIVYRNSNYGSKPLQRFFLALKISIIVAFSVAFSSILDNSISVPDEQISCQKSISDKEFDELNQMDDNRLVILVGGENPSSIPTPIRGSRPIHSAKPAKPANFPTAQTYGRGWGVNSFRTPPRIVNPNPAGAPGAPGDPDGGGDDKNPASDFSDLPAKKEMENKGNLDQLQGKSKKDLETCNLDEDLEKSKDSEENEKDPKKVKDKKKKELLKMLDRKVVIGEHTFIIEHKQVLKKVTRHGYDLGLPAHTAKDGTRMFNKKTKKPLASTSAKNCELFTNNLEQFVQEHKMKDGTFKKGTTNKQAVFVFQDEKTQRMACFNKETGKFISVWKMSDAQAIKFEDTKNIS